MAAVDLNLTAISGTLLKDYTEAGVVFTDNTFFKFGADNAIYCDGPGGSVSELVGLTLAADVTIGLQFRKRSNVGSFGVAFCATPPGADSAGLSGYYVQVATDDRITLWTINNGTFTLRGTYIFPSSANGLRQLVEVVVSATQVVVNVGGAAQITYIDETYPRGGGVYFRGAGSTASAGQHLEYIAISDASVPTSFTIVNIDGDNNIYQGQQNVVITLADGLETVPTSEPTSWYARYGGITLTPVSWNLGNPEVSVPLDLGLTIGQNYSLEVGYSI